MATTSTTGQQTACPSAVECGSSCSSSSPSSPAAKKIIPEETTTTTNPTTDTGMESNGIRSPSAAVGVVVPQDAISPLTTETTSNNNNNCNSSPSCGALMVVPEENDTNQSTTTTETTADARTKTETTHPMLVSFSSFSSNTNLPLLPFQQCAPEEVWSVLSTRSERRRRHKKKSPKNKKQTATATTKTTTDKDYKPLPCLCGKGAECNGISAAFYLLHDARSGYTPLPPPVDGVPNDDDAKTEKLSEYEVHVQQLRESYLRNLLPNYDDSAVDDTTTTTTTGYIANHHFHPTIVSRGVLPMFISKEDLVFLEAERPSSWSDISSPAEILSQHDQVLDENGQHTGDYFVVPNYKLDQTKQDLTRLLKKAARQVVLNNKSPKSENVVVSSPEKQQQENGSEGNLCPEKREKQKPTTKMELDKDNAIIISPPSSTPPTHIDAPVDETNKTGCEIQLSEFESKRKSAFDSLSLSCVTQWRSCLKASGSNVDGTHSTTFLDDDESSTLNTITQHAFDDVIHGLCDVLSKMEDASRKEHTMTFLIVCRHVFAEWFRNKDSCVEVFRQVSQSQLEQHQRNDAERLGEALMAEIKWAEARVKSTWDAYNAAAAIGDGDSAANSVASMSESDDSYPHQSSPESPTSNLELVAMRYRVAVGYQVLAWNRALIELSKLMESVTNTDNNAQHELLLDFVREQRRLRLNIVTADSNDN